MSGATTTAEPTPEEAAVEGFTRWEAEDSRIAAELIANVLTGQLPKGEKPRTITIIIKGPNHFDVHEGERYTDRLCWEEMLGQIAELTHPLIGTARFRMETPEEHQAHRERWKQDRPTPPRPCDALLTYSPTQEAP